MVVDVLFEVELRVVAVRWQVWVSLVGGVLFKLGGGVLVVG